MRKIVAGCLFLAGSLLLAQDAPLPKYKVVMGIAGKDAAATAAINNAADKGYRLLFTARFSVMRLETTPPDTYRYMPLPDNTGLNALLNALNQQGAYGYQWLRDMGILEKAPHPRNYEYATVQGFSQNSRKRSYDALQEQGFQYVREFGQQDILIREIGETHPAPSVQDVQIVDAMRVSAMMKKISALAGQGYRYRSPEVSKKGGGKALSMERCGSDCDGSLEYQSFDVKDSAQLERDLNKLGQDGFHVVAKSLDWPPHLVERPAAHRQGFVYRVVEASDEHSMEQSLNAGDRDGFVPLGLTAHVGWSVRVYIVLEKATVSQVP